MNLRVPKLYWNIPVDSSDVSRHPLPWYAYLVNFFWAHSYIPECLLLSRRSKKRVIALPKGAKHYTKDGKLECTSDEDGCWMIKEVFVDQCYDVAWLTSDREEEKKEHKDKMLVVDVGGNIGAFALWAAERNATVVSIEPVPTTFQTLAANALRTVKGEIRPVHMGLKGPNDPEGSITFTCFEDVPSCSTASVVDKHKANIEPLWDPKNFVEYYSDYRPLLCATVCWIPSFGRLRETAVRIVSAYLWRYSRSSCVLKTLEDALDLAKVELAGLPSSSTSSKTTFPKIDLLKVDVEGYELTVLKGITDKYWSFIEKVVVEVHDFDDRKQEITTLLEEKGLMLLSADEDINFKNMGMQHHMLVAKRP